MTWQPSPGSLLNPTALPMDPLQPLLCNPNTPTLLLEEGLHFLKVDWNQIQCGADAEPRYKERENPAALYGRPV